MKLRIKVRHPISGNPNTSDGSDQWDGKTYQADVDLLDVHAVGAWVSNRVGIKFDYGPGYSRVVDGRVVLFPKRRTIGVHAMWLEVVRDS
jgi:hypothetical protein